MRIVVPKLEFIKSWLSAEDFPTYEPNEDKVRSDMQALHDETRDYLNDAVHPLLQNLADAGLLSVAGPAEPGAFLRMQNGSAAWEVLTDVSEVGA